MARQLRFIKIKIGLTPHPKGVSHAYPPFNDIAPIYRDDMDWSAFFDAKGTGWHYDKVEGHGLGDEPDYWYGIVGVPQTFADQAAAMFPEDVTVLTEAEVEEFYDNRAHVNDEDEIQDAEVLSAIATKKQLGLKLSPGDREALDPDSDVRGIRKNWRKRWARYKAKTDTEVV